MKKHLICAGLFILLIIIMTFPLVFKINTAMPGFFSTDESYSPVWNAWWLKFCFLNHQPINPVNCLAYPFGNPYYLFGYLFFLINLPLAIFTNPVFTYNAQVLANLFLTAFFTYLLALVVTKNRFSAFLSGVIFGFSPYIFARSWQHLGETYLWMMPMVLWLLFSLRERITRPKQVLLVVSIVLSGIVLGTAYYTVIILAVFFLYLAIKLLIHKKSLKKEQFVPAGYIKKIIFLLFLGYLLTAVQYAGYIISSVQNTHSQASASNPYRRPFEDLFEQSARPLSYFFPAPVHPVFGKFTEQFIGTSLYGMSLTEHTLYLGWVPLILAFLAFRKWRRDRLLEDNSGYKDSFNIGFFVALAIVTWLYSQPPWWQIGPLKIFMPSFFMYKVLPMFRAYCRFGSVLMLSIAVLAGFGLKFFLERFKSRKIKIVFAVLFCGLVLFEFWNWPPYKVIDVSKVPEVYYWIKSQPGDFVIAEYPLDCNGNNEMYKFYQTVHQRKMVNGTAPGTYPNKIANTLKQLSDPKTAGVLKWLGVKYVIVHREDYLNTEIINEMDEINKISVNPKFKLVKSFKAQVCPDENMMCVQKTGAIDLYLLEASPVEPAVKDK